MRTLMLGIAAAALALPAMPASALGSDGYSGKIWRDADGRLRCKRPDGRTGRLAGAAGGALIGGTINSKGERATSTILGAAAGALLGRKIERSGQRCR